jgi:2-(1,2-epoxy-1,2-dihydrophenyl)acetyl-CoA isomerase
MQRATALMFTGDKVSAADAVAMGMIYAVTEEGENDASRAMAERLAARPTKAIGLTKKLLNSASDLSIWQQMMAEKEMQIEAANSADHKEGVAAFLEKRKPTYTGT